MAAALGSLSHHDVSAGVRRAPCLLERIGLMHEKRARRVDTARHRAQVLVRATSRGGEHPWTAGDSGVEVLLARREQELVDAEGRFRERADLRPESAQRLGFDPRCPMMPRAPASATAATSSGDVPPAIPPSTIG